MRYGDDVARAASIAADALVLAEAGLPPIVRGSLHRGRQAVALGPRGGLAVGYSPSPGRGEVALSPGLALEVFEGPILPGREELRAWLVERLQARIVAVAPTSRRAERRSTGTPCWHTRGRSSGRSMPTSATSWRCGTGGSRTRDSASLSTEQAARAGMGSSCGSPLAWASGRSASGGPAPLLQLPVDRKRRQLRVIRQWTSRSATRSETRRPAVRAPTFSFARASAEALPHVHQGFPKPATPWRSATVPASARHARNGRGSPADHGLAAAPGRGSERRSPARRRAGRVVATPPRHARPPGAPGAGAADEACRGHASVE